ncbi:hypothetical protein AHF37_07541 [Paragonimus kellicotti]|nr:hypothetical protein AHF37_07541 [Paragonimus kellicotti]
MENVILLTLFVSPEGLRNVLTRNPVLRVVTSEVHPVVPAHFGQRYFGTSLITLNKHISISSSFYSSGQFDGLIFLSISCVLICLKRSGSGNTVLKALDVLRSYNVPMENVILLTLFVSPEGLRNVLTRNPVLRVVTSEVHPVVPAHFGQRYFGTS